MAAIACATAVVQPCRAFGPAAGQSVRVAAVNGRFQLQKQRHGHRAAGAVQRVVRVHAAADAAPAVDIDELNKKFGIPGHVEVFKGLGGLPYVRLTHACGASAEICLFGACITSYKQGSGDEVLYMRPDALKVLESENPKSKPISGGIPHCFPRFGPSEDMQQHGFARNVDWEISTTSADPNPDDRDPEVTLVLSDSEYTRAMWPYKFKVAYSVALHGELLRADMRVMNADDKPFDFTCALHTYVEVLDIEEAKVRGLKGLEYLDKTVDPKNPAKKTEDREEVTFTGPTDSVYLKAKDFCELDVGTGAAVTFTSNNYADVVVWSPWTAMPDCYRSFCCVENAQFSTPVNLGPGEFWRAQAEWGVRDLE